MRQRVGRMQGQCRGWGWALTRTCWTRGDKPQYHLLSRFNKNEVTLVLFNALVTCIRNEVTLLPVNALLICVQNEVTLLPFNVLFVVK